ncbi:MAG: hypothetical protein HQK58_15105 [Deltaproteobacteria bacterium]|nr:hypothetical protein [Deltaproteobacteria bacterium]
MRRRMPQYLDEGPADVMPDVQGLMMDHYGDGPATGPQASTRPGRPVNQTPTRFRSQAEAEQAYREAVRRLTGATQQTAALAKENQIYKDVLSELIGHPLPPSLDNPHEDDPHYDALDKTLRHREAALKDREFQQEAILALHHLLIAHPELKRYTKLLEVELLYLMDDPNTSLTQKFVEAGRRVLELVGEIKGEGSRQALEKRETLKQAGVVSGGGMERKAPDGELAGQSPEEYVAMRRKLRYQTGQIRR